MEDLLLKGQRRAEDLSAVQLKVQADLEVGLGRRLEQLGTLSASVDALGQALQAKLEEVEKQQSLQETRLQELVSRCLEQLLHGAAEASRSAAEAGSRQLAERLEELRSVQLRLQAEAAEGLTRRIQELFLQGQERADRSAESLRHSLRVEVSNSGSRHDALMEAVREGGRAQTESFSELHRLTLAMQQVASRQERTQASLAKVTEFALKLDSGFDRVMRAVRDVGSGIQDMQVHGQRALQEETQQAAERTTAEPPRRPQSGARSRRGTDQNQWPPSPPSANAEVRSNSELGKRPATNRDWSRQVSAPNPDGELYAAKIGAIASARGQDDLSARLPATVRKASQLLEESMRQQSARSGMRVING